jgi:hypothetical protein
MSGRLVEITNYPSRDRVRDLMRDARREQAETVAELFGFGFTVIRDVVQARHDRRGVIVKLPSAVSS